MSMSHITFSSSFALWTRLCRTAALLAAVLIPGLAAAQAPPSYSGYTAARFIPFENARRNLPPLTDTPTLKLAIQGTTFIAEMDTGSTGVMLSATKIPGYTPSNKCEHPLAYTGSQFLSSSKKLWVGNWIEKEIDFLDTNGTAIATARIPVLAVECETVCPDYDEKAAQPVCPGKSLGTASQEIRYMGVGFGREYDGQPQGTPDKNPLINIVRIDGAPVQPGTMRSGYIVTPAGVHVGLTAANTSEFAYTRLTRPEDSKGPRDWSEASICVSVDDSPCVPGSVLVDTGIRQMYLSVPSNVPVKSRPGQPLNVLEDGSRVTVKFPGDQDTAAFYSFVVGQETPMAPSQVFLPRGGSTFVNTGRHFLRRFDILFDADGGWFGLRWTGPPDFIVYGGDVVTMDDSDTVAEAVWVHDGKIEAVGAREEVLRHATKMTELIDLRGGALLPGFIDPHVHLDVQTLMSFYVDLNPCLPDRYETREDCPPPTISGALAIMKKAADQAKEGEWVIGNGIDPSLMPLNEVDKVRDFHERPAWYIEKHVSEKNPVIIVDKSGHVAYANLQAFVSAGICKNVKACSPCTASPGSPQPPGKWAFSQEDGLFTGLLIEQQAYWPFMSAIPQQSAEELLERAQEWAEDFARGGVTTIGNGGTQVGTLGQFLLPTLALQSLDRPLLRYRALVPVAPAGDNAQVPSKPSPAGELYGGLFGVTGIKLWADGTTQGCTANLIDPYAEKGLCSDGAPAGLSAKDIHDDLEQFWKKGWPVQIHVNGDQGIREVLNALALLQLETRNDSPITLIHFTVNGNPAKGEDIVQEVADLRAGRFVVDGKSVPPVDVRVSHLIGHVAYWGGALQNILDGVSVPEQPDEEGRAARIDATGRDLELGVPFSLHSDAPVSPVRPLWYVEQAVTRNTWFYPNFGDKDVHTMPGGQKITIEQALRAVTIEPAYQHGLDRQIGSIEVGKLADLVILDKNPLEQEPDEIHRIRVLTTFVGGYRNDWANE